MYGIIYKATNKLNGKVYVGQTTFKLEDRIKEHIKSAKRRERKYYFHKAIRKYGEDNFIWEVIAECNSKEELNKTEIEMIRKYNAFGTGYNLSIGGEGNSGLIHSAETRKKLSMYRGERGSFYGKHHTKEVIKRISESQKGIKGFNYGKYGQKSSIARRYIITTPEGKEFLVHGLADFCRNYKVEKLYHANLVKVANGERKHHKGYGCKRIYEELITCQR